MNLTLLSVFLWTAQVAYASKKLMADALVACDNTDGITSKNLNVVYDHAEKTVYYNASVNVDFSAKVYAEISVFIYGLNPININIDPCSSTAGKVLAQFCPVKAGSIEISGQTNIGDIANKIPGIAFSVPDIDAYAVVKIRDLSTNAMLSCLYVEVKNSQTVEQTAVKWVTAVLSGVGLLVSSLLSFLGVSVDSQNISAVTVLMLNYFQSMAFLDMEAVQRVPPITSAWCDNVAWSVGLVYSTFLEKIFRWYVQATGGDPATYKVYKTKSVLVQKLRKRAVDTIQAASTRSLEWLENTKLGQLSPGGFIAGVSELPQMLSRRRVDPNEDYAQTSNNLVVYRGIERLSFKSGIEVTSTVLTSYTIFIFVCVCVVFLFSMLWIGMHFGTRKEREEAERLNEKQMLDDPVNPDNVSTTFTSYEGPQSRAVFFYHLIPSMLKGTLLKLWYVAFPPVMLFSLWEWYHNDSPAVIVLSVVMFVVCLVLVLFHIVKMFLLARKSQLEAGTATYMLYAEPRTLQKYGYLYSMFDAKYYYFGVVYLAYNLVKAIFLAFAQSNGKVQALALFIIELAMFIVVVVMKPFLSKAVNGIQITSHVIATINACFFLFFSNLMTQPLIVNGVMGVVFFVLNAAFSLVLLLYIIIYSIICIIWHKRQGSRPDNRTRDDRQSFIMDPKGRTQEFDELQALGKAAQADHDTGTHANTPEWFNHDSALETHSSNPFEPLTAPSTFHRSAERYSLVSDSRTHTLSSETSGVLNNEFGTMGHRNTESQTSFGLHNPDQSDLTLFSGTDKKTPRMSKLFKRG